MTKESLKRLVREEIEKGYGTTINYATKAQMFGAVISITKEYLGRKRAELSKAPKNPNSKNIYYMSMEFLVGKSLKNWLYNLQLEETFSEVLSEAGYSLEELYELEADAGLGNGGLGRLAACYLSSLTTLDYAATGFSILYEYGTFKQKIIDGIQREFPDNWLESSRAVLNERPDEAVEVYFDGYIKEEWTEKGLTTVHCDYYKVIAVPSDLYVSGFDSKRVNVLRLWTAKSPIDIDIELFSSGQYAKAVENAALAESISKILYPADNHIEGKNLRLKQQYFFVSASLQTIIKKHLQKHGDLKNLPDHVVIQINDTHPALCVPELMRILMDDHQMSWEEAWGITTKTLAYTNHTVMAEALESWPSDLFCQRLPRIYSIVTEINRRFCNEMFEKHPDMRSEIASMAVCQGDRILMANLCIIAGFSVNGVSKLHTEILKNDLFKSFYKIYPEKFHNVTNGIYHRRWLGQANRRLNDLIMEKTGKNPDYDLTALRDFEGFKNDLDTVERFFEIKQENKARLAEYIKENNHIDVDTASIFDIQVKRLHEYKRQLLNALHILSLYLKIKNEGLRPYPRTFIFAAKAAAGYQMAKEIIRFIVALSKLINGDELASKYIKVVFLEDYKVSLAELIIPAADVSEQISLAGLEASGTGNMKFQLSGAVTLGTLDGANVEMHEQLGDENIVLFGMHADQVQKRREMGYFPQSIYYANTDINRALNFILDGGLNGDFNNLAYYLMNTDYYMVLADFESYAGAQQKIEDLYKDRQKWGQIAITNVARSGIFSSDRSVREYAEQIWNTKPAY